MLAANKELVTKVFATNKVCDIKGDSKLKSVKPKIEKKLFKFRKIKYEKLSKSQKLAKSKNKLSKSENSPHFSAKEAKPSFLIFGAKRAFNYL